MRALEQKYHVSLLWTRIISFIIMIFPLEAKMAILYALNINRKGSCSLVPAGTRTHSPCLGGGNKTLKWPYKEDL